MSYASDLRLEVHRRNHNGELIFEKSLLKGDELTCAVLPGFGVRVDSIFV